MEELTRYESELVRAARSLAPSDPPKPWRQAAFIGAGGVTTAGWTAEENVLLLSADGYSVTAPSGERLARDPDAARGYAGLSPDSLSFALPGQASPVQVFGLCGGDGSWVTADAWSLEVIHPMWPRPSLVMRPPTGPGATGYLDGVTRLELQGLDEHDWLRAGFSPSGNHMLVVSTSGCMILTRAPNG
jgi:hypothetical protein